MRAVCARSLAAEALDDERFEEARRCAEQALSCSAQCLYPDAALQVSAAGILARCAAAEGSAAEADAAFETYRETYLRWQSGVGYHLTLARFDLEREHVQAAEREIWSITELPEASRAEYLILRGRIAARKEQYENAILYLKQAEEIEGLPKILRRELLMGWSAATRKQSSISWHMNTPLRSGPSERDFTKTRTLLSFRLRSLHSICYTVR